MKLLILLLMPCFAWAQFLPSIDPKKDMPRNKMDYDKPGHYEMATQVTTSEIDPGGDLIINIFFTGYGQIRASKVFFITAAGIFDSTTSFCLHDLSVDNKREIRWGKDTFKLTDPQSFNISLGGIGTDKWKETSIYVDLSNYKDSSNLYIMTEIATESAPPLSIHLKALDKNKISGVYTATLVYTYFNGEQWQGVSQNITFKIRNVIERNVGWAWVTGIGLFIISVIGVLPILAAASKRTYSWAANKLAAKKTTLKNETQAAK